MVGDRMIPVLARRWQTAADIPQRRGKSPAVNLRVAVLTSHERIQRRSRRRAKARNLLVVKAV